jgi:hypothetical protein
VVIDCRMYTRSAVVIFMFSCRMFPGSNVTCYTSGGVALSQKESRGSVVVEALSYKPEGRGFETLRNN